MLMVIDRRKVLFGLLAVLCFLLSANSQNKTELVHLKTKKDVDYTRHPNHVKRYILKTLKRKPSISDSLRARYYDKLNVIYGIYAQEDSATYYFKKSIESAGGNMQMLGDFYVHHSINLRNEANYNQAFKALHYAKENYLKDGDSIGVGKVYTEIGAIYNYKLETGKAIKALKKAIHAFDSIGEKDYILYAKHELANTYMNSDKPEFAKILYEDILPEMKKKKPGIGYHFLLLNYARSLLSLGQYKRSEAIYQKIRDYFAARKNKKYVSFSTYKLAQIKEKTLKYDEALSLYNKAFHEMISIQSPQIREISGSYLKLLNQLGKNEKAACIVETMESLKDTIPLKNDHSIIYYLTQVKETFKQNHRYADAVEVLERIGRLKDSIQEQKNTTQLQVIQDKYRNKYERKRNKILTEKNNLLKAGSKRKTIILILISSLFATAIIITFLWYKKQKREHFLQQKLLKNTTQSKKNLKIRLEMEAQLHEKRKEILLIKERELVASSLKIADFQNGIRNLIKTFKKDRGAQKLLRKLKIMLNNEDGWNYFVEQFTCVYPRFKEQLKAAHPNLTQNDIRCCALIKLGMSNKEMAQLMNISHQSVITKRYRLRKKLGIDQNTNNTTLEQWIDEQIKNHS